MYPVTRYQGLLPEQMETGPDSSYVEMNTADKVRRMTADSGYMEMTSPMKGTSSASRKMRLNNTGICTIFFFKLLFACLCKGVG